MELLIPFRIGYQYDNWERYLDTQFDSEEEVFKDKLYCRYHWIGEKQKKFLGIIPNDTELIFYWDILITVILKFSNTNKNNLNTLHKNLTNKFKNYEKITINKVAISKFTNKAITYWYFTKLEYTFIIYGNLTNVEIFYKILFC